LAKQSRYRLIAIFSVGGRSVSLSSRRFCCAEVFDETSSDDTGSYCSYAISRCCCTFPINTQRAIDNGLCEPDVRLLHRVGGSPAIKRFQSPEEGCFRQTIYGREKQIRSAAAALFLPYRGDRWLRHRRACSRGSHQANTEGKPRHRWTCRAGNARGLTRYGRAEAGAL
jgi:hypothetical protein